MKINELNLDGYKHIKNNEWEYPSNLLDYLSEHNFKKQGKGHFSEVWASDTENFVVKINMGKNYDENYLKFVDYCHQNKGNPHLPKMGQIKQMKTPDNKNFYILFIEKLKPVTPEMFGFVGFAAKTSFSYCIIDICNEYFNYIIFQNGPTLEEIIKKQLNLYTNNITDNQYQIILELSKTYIKLVDIFGKSCIDIKIENIMQRNDGTIVITDPVY